LSISIVLYWNIQYKVALLERRCCRHGNMVAATATFLTPPLKFDQADHTQPSLRHHGSILVACFGYDAAISGKMIRRPHRHGKTFSSLGGGGNIPHSPTQIRPSRSYPTISKTSWIDLGRLLRVRRRYWRRNEPPPALEQWQKLHLHFSQFDSRGCSGLSGSGLMSRQNPGDGFLFAQEDR
jgi:hypothetical protein